MPDTTPTTPVLKLFKVSIPDMPMMAPVILKANSPRQAKVVFIKQNGWFDEDPDQMTLDDMAELLANIEVEAL